ncbi:MAG: hypothetical protein QOE64_298 [Frankiales bacterium]|jgi:hypothetical protein|nr:hypothetical protein [Frankiales bacterium]
MRRALGALGLLWLLASCTSSGAGPNPALVTIQESALPGSFVQDSVDTQVGVLRVRVLTAKCGIETIVGTHAEYTPKHPLCVVRLRLTNDSSAFVTFDADLAQVLDISVPLGVAKDVMNIKRQAHSVQISSHGTVEQDLWFEPVNSRPEILRLPPIPDASGHLIRESLRFQLSPGQG